MQSYDSTGGFGTRRKRNLDLSEVPNNKTEIMTGIWWGDEKKNVPVQDDIESGWEDQDVEDISEPSPVSAQNTKKPSNHPEFFTSKNGILSLNGRPIRFQGTGSEKSFEETHVRFTSYLEHELFIVVKALKKQGHIRSITELVNESIKHYLVCSKA